MKTHIVIYTAICVDVAQGRMNGAPNETRTHSCRHENPYLSNYRLNSITVVPEGRLWRLITLEDDYAIKQRN